MDKQQVAMVIQEGSKLISALMQTYRRPRPDHSLASTVKLITDGELTTDETIRYQKREIGKELLLLEKHLQQGCKIAGKGGQVLACDCCGGKHLITLEGLAQETLGMTSDPALNEVIQWVREIEPKTTEDASASGKYDSEYPSLAIKARELRKAIMGTESPNALLGKEGGDETTKKATEG